MAQNFIRRYYKGNSLGTTVSEVDRHDADKASALAEQKSNSAKYAESKANSFLGEINTYNQVVADRASEMRNLSTDNMNDYYDRWANTINSFNAESAQKQMDFQERMSSTSHQREVADLISAGLNPVLSANNGASTPQGSSTSYDSAAQTARVERDTQLKSLKLQLANAKEIAAMNNETNLAITQMNNDTSKENTQYTANSNANINDHSLAIQKIISDNTLSMQEKVALINQETSKYAVDTSAETADKDRKSREDINQKQIDSAQAIADKNIQAGHDDAPISIALSAFGLGSGSITVPSSQFRSISQYLKEGKDVNVGPIIQQYGDNDAKNWWKNNSAR